MAREAVEYFLEGQKNSPQSAANLSCYFRLRQELEMSLPPSKAQRLLEQEGLPGPKRPGASQPAYDYISHGGFGGSGFRQTETTTS